MIAACFLHLAHKCSLDIYIDVVTICPLVVKSIVTTFESDTVVETFLGAQENFFEATQNTLLYGEHVATPGGDRQGGLEA